jgi:ribosomal protein S21
MLKHIYNFKKESEREGIVKEKVSKVFSDLISEE